MKWKSESLLEPSDTVPVELAAEPIGEVLENPPPGDRAGDVAVRFGFEEFAARIVALAAFCAAEDRRGLYATCHTGIETPTWLCK